MVSLLTANCQMWSKRLRSRSKMISYCLVQLQVWSNYFCSLTRKKKDWNSTLDFWTLNFSALMNCTTMIKHLNRLQWIGCFLSFMFFLSCFLLLFVTCTFSFCCPLLKQLENQLMILSNYIFVLSVLVPKWNMTKIKVQQSKIQSRFEFFTSMHILTSLNRLTINCYIPTFKCAI